MKDELKTKQVPDGCSRKKANSNERSHCLCGYMTEEAEKCHFRIMKDIPIVNSNFKDFQQIVRASLIVKEPFDSYNEWMHGLYVEYKETAHCFSSIIEWAENFFQDVTLDTHPYCLVSKLAAIQPIAEGEEADKPVSPDWTEDFSHENGNYQNRCIHCDCLFMGHKRRVTCKVCAQPKFNFRSKFDYVQSLSKVFGLDEQERETFLWILDMWDRKKEMPEPKPFELPKSFNPPKTVKR